MTSAAIYVRISSDPKGRAAGVTRQERECRDLLRTRGWDLLEVYRDNDVSATSGRTRPAWEEMIAAVGRGDATVVVAWAQDRLYRSTRDQLRVMEVVRDVHGSIVTVKDGDVNPNSAEGRMRMGILANVAEFEAGRASERQIARWRQRKEDGKLVNLGRRPFGYRREGDALVLDDREAKLVRDTVTNLLNGSSLYRVVAELQASGVKTPYGNDWAPSHVKRMLQSRVLLGGATWPALVSDDEHRLLAARLEVAPKNKGRMPGRKYPASGLLVCGICGTKAQASTGSYRCPRGHVGIKAFDVERHLLEQWVAYGTRKPREKASRRTPAPPAVDLSAVHTELLDVETRLEDLASNLDLSERQLAARSRALEARRDELTAQLSSTQPDAEVGVRVEVERDGSAVRVVSVEPVLSGGTDFIERWRSRTLSDAEVIRFHDMLAYHIESVVVNPAVRNGRHVFDPARVTIAWR